MAHHYFGSKDIKISFKDSDFYAKNVPVIVNPIQKLDNPMNVNEIGYLI